MMRRKDLHVNLKLLGSNVDTQISNCQSVSARVGILIDKSEYLPLNRIEKVHILEQYSKEDSNL